MDDDRQTKLGHNKISDKKQVRVPDDALEELNATISDLLGFKNCPEDDFIKITKIEADY